MKRISPFVLGLSLAVFGTTLAAAQEMSSMPKVLEITREYVKPGKAGAAHDHTESAFVQDMARAKWPTYYVAVNSLSGKVRALYLIGYDSFTAWQKDSDAVGKDMTLAAELDHASMADGELLDSMDQFVFYYDDDLSYRPNGDLSQARYLEVTSFHIRSGHGKEWHDLVALVIDADKKAGTSAHWATYELEYGGGDDYAVFSADKSMADIDQGFAENQKFRDAMGEDGMKRLHELEASAIESTDSELFAINPRQSYPPPEWVKANPDFWKPKPTMAPAAKPSTDKKPKP